MTNDYIPLYIGYYLKQNGENKMSRYAHTTFQEERDHDNRVAYEAKLALWLQSHPEVGTLNRGAKTVFYTNDPYAEIEAFSI